MALSASLNWVFEDPREVLNRLSFETGSRLSPFLVLISAVLSFSVADVWMVPATIHALPVTGFIYAVDSVAWIFLFSRLSRLWNVPKVAFRSWWRAGVIAVVPFHLALPAALLLRPFGTDGFILYEFFKLILFASVLRRWVWAVEGFNNWPPWASTLLVAGPFIMVVSVLMVGALLGVGAASIAVLGILK